MLKEIQYSGYSTVPSDYECADGQLATSLNLISEDNQLKPLFQPSTLFSLPSDTQLLFIHQTAAFKHFIVIQTAPRDFDSKTNPQTKGTRYLKWLDADDLKRLDADDLKTTGISSDYMEAKPWILQLPDANTQIYQINSVGNTLILQTDTAMHYCLWTDNAYKDLGTHLPEIKLNIGLLGRPRFYSLVYGDTFDISFDRIVEGSLNKTFSEENQTKITSQIMAKLNKFVADTTVNHGRHCFPFFVRYALRLYDGTLTMASAPILMNPCSLNGGPIVMWDRISGKGSYNSATINMMLVAASITWRINSLLDQEANSLSEYNKTFADWSDIVKSVDIFISKPLYTYDQSGKVTSFHDSDNFNQFFIGKLYVHHSNKDNSIVYADADEPRKSRLLSSFSDGSGEIVDTAYTKWAYSEIYAMYFEPKRTKPSTTLHLPEFAPDTMADTVAGVSNFYLLHSIPYDEVLARLATAGFTEIVTPNDYLPSLVARETLPDDYQSHDTLVPRYSFSYNNRLNIANITRTLFPGFDPETMLAYCERSVDYSVTKHDDGSVAVNVSYATVNDVSVDGTIDIYTFIKHEGTEYVVKNKISESTVSAQRSLKSLLYVRGYSAWLSAAKDDDDNTNNDFFLPFLFYPDPNAYKMVIRQTDPHDPSGSYHIYYEIPLTAHPTLHGAYAMPTFADVKVLGVDNEDLKLALSSNITSTVVTAPTESSNLSILYPNKIYTSEENNPFYFPVLGINTVGTGTILGICSAVKALSQGQFGQFPLYAFTTDGVWALEVSSTGTFSAKQPVTRDVCINSHSITQIDNAVLFATDRGIMLIQGSQTQCITDAIYSESPFNVLDLPCIDQLHSKLGHEADACLPVKPFLGFLADCRMLYDYVHQRIIVYNATTDKDSNKPVYTYAYIFSLKSKQWGMMFSNLKSTLSAYPDAMAMTTGNSLVSFSGVGETTCKGLYITRPLKLEMADVHKTISSLIQRGHFQRGDVATVLYGSRDLYTWRLVWSSRDHYLRGFRGTPYKYFRIAGLATLTDGKSIFGASVQFNTSLTNNLR